MLCVALSLVCGQIEKDKPNKFGMSILLIPFCCLSHCCKTARCASFNCAVVQPCHRAIVAMHFCKKKTGASPVFQNFGNLFCRVLTFAIFFATIVARKGVASETRLVFRQYSWFSARKANLIARLLLWQHSKGLFLLPQSNGQVNSIFAVTCKGGVC